MSQKRKARPVAPAAVPDPGPAVEAAPLAPPEEAPLPPERKGVIWRILGGTALATVLLVGVAVYQQLQAQVTYLRSELKALNKETRRELTALGSRQGDLTKRAEHDSRVRLIWDAVKELRTDRSELGRLKERCGLLLDLYKSGEDDRRQLLADVRKLSEKKPGDENQALVRELRALRDRIAQLESAAKGQVSTTGHFVGPMKP